MKKLFALTLTVAGLFATVVAPPTAEAAESPLTLSVPASTSPLLGADLPATDYLATVCNSPLAETTSNCWGEWAEAAWNTLGCGASIGAWGLAKRAWRLAKAAKKLKKAATMKERIKIIGKVIAGSCGWAAIEIGDAINCTVTGIMGDAAAVGSAVSGAVIPLVPPEGQEHGISATALQEIADLIQDVRDTWTEVGITESVDDYLPDGYDPF